MQQKKKLGVDVILSVLQEAHTASPNSEFIRSLLFQYQERGGLSKKQLEGLHSKASKIGTISEAKLATLQAIILKKHSKHKSEKPTPVNLVEEQDKEIGNAIDIILAKYPQHKRVLFYKTKYDKNDSFSTTEKEELLKFLKVLKLA